MGRPRFGGAVFVLALAVALAAPASAEAVASIDPYRFDFTGTACADGARPGATAVLQWLMRHDAVGSSGGIYACRTIQGTDSLSLHAEGRAVDWVLDNRDARQRSIADGIVAGWLKRRHGQHHALARRMGVQEIIWNCTIWRSDRPGDGLVAYPPCATSTDRTVRHENHLHVGLNHDGADQRAGYWTQGAWPQDLLAIETGPTRAAVRVLDGGSNYSSRAGGRPVRLARNPNRTFGLYGDYDRDGIDDLFLVEYGSPDRRVRVALYAGATRFGSTPVVRRTALTTPRGAKFAFGLGDHDHDGRLDLYAIEHGNGRSPLVHVLDGADRYRSLLRSVRTPLRTTSARLYFAVGDPNNDGIDDIYAVAPGRRATKVTILDGAGNFRSFQGSVATKRLRGSGSGAQFLVGDANDDGLEDLYRISFSGSSGTIRIASAAGPAFTAGDLRARVRVRPSARSSWTFALPAQPGL